MTTLVEHSALAVQVSGGAALWEPCTAFTLDGLAADAGDRFEMWGVARVVAGGWTVLAGTEGCVVPVGAEHRWEDTLCASLQRGPEAALAGDLRRRRDPEVRAKAERFGLRAYVGAPLLQGGRLVGSLCGWSRTPTTDDDALRARVTRNASFLGATLARELHRVDQERREDWARKPSSRDHLTRLPDRRSWGQLLQHEDDRGRSLAEPAAVTVVDVGTVSSTRALRRLAGALRESSGSAGVVARTGARQFGVLSTSTPEEGPLAVSERVLEQLRSAAPQARAGSAVRRGQTSLAEVWVAAEGDLLSARHRATR
ncbi:GGDEF domain-containing protein [Streptomyces sp. NP160]|uniref:GGDEF domain-containing protein n=1 Tax=Streptomyces sp. NP160 TaxID=2586637 RepID=UPI0015D58BA5|nr:GGDEF domain-containing protein [Streptomyces sp. NP160]